MAVVVVAAVVVVVVAANGGNSCNIVVIVVVAVVVVVEVGVGVVLGDVPCKLQLSVVMGLRAPHADVSAGDLVQESAGCIEGHLRITFDVHGSYEYSM